MQIVCLADDSREMLRLIFTEKKRKKRKYFKMSFAVVVIGTFRVKGYIYLPECCGYNGMKCLCLLFRFHDMLISCKNMINKHLFQFKLVCFYF